MSKIEDKIDPHKDNLMDIKSIMRLLIYRQGNIINISIPPIPPKLPNNLDGGGGGHRFQKEV